MTENDNTPMRGEDIAEALGLLTRLPVAAHGRRGASAAWAWPVAGAIVAFLAGLVGHVALWLSLPSALAAALALAALVVMTGAMHEDGLADCADGFWGADSPERRLAIMKDSHIGSYGVIALALSLAIRWAALSNLFATGHVVGPLVAAAALSRVPMVAVMRSLTSAREGGLSDRVGRPAHDTLVLAAVVGLLVALLFSGFSALVAAATAALAAWAAALIAQDKINGQTGDVLGATQQIAELAALLAFAAILA